MKTPEEILNEVAAENMINIQQMVTTKQLAVIAMRRYAKLYHESKVKNLDIQRVSFSEADNVIKTPIECEATINDETPKYYELNSETEVCKCGLNLCFVDEGKLYCSNCRKLIDVSNLQT